MISFTQKGDFSNLTSFFNRCLHTINMSKLDKYGREGVQALSSATPIKTGKTASSWEYDIDIQPDSVTISFYNTNVQNDTPIAIIIDRGHGTKNGGYVRGRNYIKPAILPVFDRIADGVWEEVTRK